MNVWECFRAAFRALQTNMLRSFLTMLGIIIGVSSVITMVAVGSGAQTRVIEQIQTLGANLLMVMPGVAREGGARLKSGSRHTLTEEDAEAIAQNVPLVSVAAPSIRNYVQVVSGNKNWNTTVNGTTAAYFVAREWPLAAGRYFLSGEQTSAAKVALLGQTIAKELFAGTDPVGQNIRIQNTPFEVIGTLAEKGTSGMGRDQDDIVFVPIAAAKTRLIGSAHAINRQSVNYVLVKATSSEAINTIAKQITTLLRVRHRITRSEPSDFRVTNPAAAMSAQKKAANTIAMLLAAIASISLVVGGISIMNIMLVSVTERTREIGLRLAVGARRRDVRNQFLIEAVTLSLSGGVVGIIVGVAASLVVADVFGWPIFLGPESLIFAIGFAAAVGIFFGYYPALKASRLNPIEALRFE